MGNITALRGDAENDVAHRVTVIHYHNGDKYEG